MSYRIALTRVAGHHYPGAVVSFLYFTRVSPVFSDRADHDAFWSVLGDAEMIDVRGYAARYDLIGALGGPVREAIRGRHPVADAWMNQGWDIEETGERLPPPKDNYHGRPYYLAPDEVGEVYKTLAAFDAEKAFDIGGALGGQRSGQDPEAVRARVLHGFEKLLEFYRRAAESRQLVMHYSG